MSHQEFLFAFDEGLLEAIVRQHRAVAAIASRAEDGPRRIDGGHAAARALRDTIAGAAMPANREREEARRELAELERRAAPEYLREIVRARAEPREVVLRDLDAGQLPSLGTALDVAARASLGLYEPYRQLGWLADPRRREVAEEFEDWPFLASVGTDPEIDALLFGAAPVTVDGLFVDAFNYPYVTERRAGWHRVAELPRVRSFVLGLREREPPPLEVYRRWYRAVHAQRFAMSTEALTVPTGGALTWDYAVFLAGQHKFIDRLARFLGRASARRWAIVVYIE